MMRDQLFRMAVAALDAGDVEVLRQLLAEHPDLAATRLDEPGAWLKQRARRFIAREAKDAAAARRYRAIADYLEAKTGTP